MYVLVIVEDQFQKGTLRLLAKQQHPDQTIREDRSSILEDLNVRVGNSGADEHSHIAQADAAITPGSSVPILHLLGTAHVPQSLQGEYAYIIGSAYADREVSLEDMPIDDMEFGAQCVIASLQISNSIGGRNQDTKAKMINGIGQITRNIGRIGRRRNGYDSAGDE